MNKLVGFSTLFILLIISFTSAQVQTLSDSLIAYYDFEQTTGPLVDKVNALHNGIIMGTISNGVNGIIGNAFEFSANGYINLTTPLIHV